MFVAEDQTANLPCLNPWPKPRAPNAPDQTQTDALYGMAYTYSAPPSLPIRSSRETVRADR